MTSKSWTSTWQTWSYGKPTWSKFALSIRWATDGLVSRRFASEQKRAFRFGLPSTLEPTRSTRPAFACPGVNRPLSLLTESSRATSSSTTRIANRPKTKHWSSIWTCWTSPLHRCLQLAEVVHHRLWLVVWTDKIGLFLFLYNYKRIENMDRDRASE